MAGYLFYIFDAPDYLVACRASKFQGQQKGGV